MQTEDTSKSAGQPANLLLTSRSVLSTSSQINPMMVVTSNHPRSPKWTLRGRFWDKTTPVGNGGRRKMPGPGEYDVSNFRGNFFTASKPVFDRTPRFKEPPSRQIKAPGVGAYDPKYSLLEPQPLRVPFGSSKRPDITGSHGSSTDSLAGPGSYAIPSKLSESPGVSMKGRNWVRPSKSTIIHVGPGEYQLPPIRSTTGRLFSFARAPRNAGTARKGPAPAVGTYNVHTWRSLGTEAPKIALSGRPKNWNLPVRTAVGLLGPGAYNAATTSFGY